MSEVSTELKELVMAMSGCDGDCDSCSADVEGTPVREETLEDLADMLRSAIKLRGLPKLTEQELVEVRVLLGPIIPSFTLALLVRDVEAMRKLPYIILAIILLQERGLEYEPADKFLELLCEIF